jgi:hypothetical protein
MHIRLELTFLYSWWSYSDINVYADPKDLECLKHEYALNLVNHRYEIDWLVGMVAAQKLGLIGVNDWDLIQRKSSKLLT